MKHRDLYIEIARACAKKSHAKRGGVGAVIVSPNGSIISHGWNGMPSGMDNCCEDLVPMDTNETLRPGERGMLNPFTGSMSRLVTKPEVLHAELNAIGKAAEDGRSLRGATMFVTLSPCLSAGCSKLIHRSGISHVHYLEEYRDTAGIDFLRACGVLVTKEPE